MSIVSGYKKFKKYILTSSGFQLVSHWTNANTLQFDDGKTAQAKLGAIDGISSSKDSSSEKIAASTKLVSELNSNLGGQFGGMTFWVNDTGDPCVTYKVGADSVSKKLGRSPIVITGIYFSLGHGAVNDGGTIGACGFSKDNHFTFDVTDYEIMTIGTVSISDKNTYDSSYIRCTVGSNSYTLKSGLAIDISSAKSATLYANPSGYGNLGASVQSTVSVSSITFS